MLNKCPSEWNHFNSSTSARWLGSPFPFSLVHRKLTKINIYIYIYYDFFPPPPTDDQVEPTHNTVISTACTDTACVPLPTSTAHPHAHTLRQNWRQNWQDPETLEQKKKKETKKKKSRGEIYWSGSWIPDLVKLTGQRDKEMFRCQWVVQRFVGGRKHGNTAGGGKGWQGGGAALTTDPRCRNSLPCCASPACCPRSRSCRTASRKGAGSSRSLDGSRGEGDTHTWLSRTFC